MIVLDNVPFVAFAVSRAMFFFVVLREFSCSCGSGAVGRPLTCAVWIDLQKKSLLNGI